MWLYISCRVSHKVSHKLVVYNTYTTKDNISNVYSFSKVENINQANENGNGVLGFATIEIYLLLDKIVQLWKQYFKNYCGI